MSLTGRVLWLLERERRCPASALVFTADGPSPSSHGAGLKGAGIFAARWMRACQDLHAKRWTWPTICLVFQSVIDSLNIAVKCDKWALKCYFGGEEAPSMSAAALAQHDPLCTPGSPHSLSFGVRVDAAPRLNI